MKEIEELQAKAAQCRRLARDAMDVSVSVSLDALAVELDAQAEAASLKVNKKLRVGSTTRSGLV